MTGTSLAEDAFLNASKYEISIQHSGITPLSITCSPWSAWITSTSYCEPDIYGLACMCTTLPFSVEFKDQYRYRTCTNTLTGQQTVEYQFRTVRSGCCGAPLGCLVGP